MAGKQDELWVHYYAGNKNGKEFLEFEVRPDGQMTYAEYKESNKTRETIAVPSTVLRDMKKAIEESEILKEHDESWPQPDHYGRQELEIVCNNEEVSFTTTKLLSLSQIKASRDPTGLRKFYYLVLDLQRMTRRLISNKRRKPLEEGFESIRNWENAILQARKCANPQDKFDKHYDALDHLMKLAVTIPRTQEPEGFRDRLHEYMAEGEKLKKALDEGEDEVEDAAPSHTRNQVRLESAADTAKKRKFSPQPQQKVILLRRQADEAHSGRPKTAEKDVADSTGGGKGKCHKGEMQEFKNLPYYPSSTQNIDEDAVRNMVVECQDGIVRACFAARAAVDLANRTADRLPTSFILVQNSGCPAKNFQSVLDACEKTILTKAYRHLAEQIAYGVRNGISLRWAVKFPSTAKHMEADIWKLLKTLRSAQHVKVVQDKKSMKDLCADWMMEVVAWAERHMKVPAKTLEISWPKEYSHGCNYSILHKGESIISFDSDYLSLATKTLMSNKAFPGFSVQDATSLERLRSTPFAIQFEGVYDYIRTYGRKAGKGQN